MVSNANDDLPDPLSPVMTVRVFRGISTLIFFRLCWRAPLTVMLVRPIVKRFRNPMDAPATDSMPLEQYPWIPKSILDCSSEFRGVRTQFYSRILFATNEERQFRVRV